MTDTSIRSYQESLTVGASAGELYDLVSAVTPTGQWSPVFGSGWWDEQCADGVGAGRVGGWFTGCNELPHRSWETRSQVVVADGGRGFAWVVGGSVVRWGLTLDPVAAGSGSGAVLTESREFLPAGIAMFEERFGADAQVQIVDRRQHALEGLPVTLRAIQRIAEAPTAPGDGSGSGEVAGS